MIRTKYLILGAGAAGLYLARQLARKQAGKIVLVEAGSVANDIRSSVPVYYPKLFGSRLDWQYQTVPQPHLNNRRIPWPRGKSVGGSAAINAMIYMEAANADYQRWGWDWASELSTQLTVESERNCSPHPWSNSFVLAASEFGLEKHEPLKKSQARTCGIFLRSVRNGRRSCALWQSLDSPIELFTNTTVSKLLVHRGEALGAVLIDGLSGAMRTVEAEYVILAAGSIGSPEILLRSGIGNVNDLTQVEVDCVHELNGVGRNLQDHLVVPLVFKTRFPDGLPRRHDRSSRDEFRQAGTGPLASNIAEAGAFLQRVAPDNSGSHASPDYQIHFTPTHYLKYPFTPTEDQFLSLAISDLHPTSRGSVRLIKGHGDIRVEIDPKYLSDERDVSRLIDGLRCGRRLVQSDSLANLIESEVFPGPTRSADEQIARSIRTFAQSIYHPVGTCCMQSHAATLDSSDCVVDHNFRVLGLHRLHVVDASVLPDLPSGNTAAVTYLLAHRAADLLAN